jgi:glycosyltransferase involved in cell wall biosynthesis
MEPAHRLISVVIPVLDEEDSLAELATRLDRMAQSHGLRLEVIFVDDGSRDGSWQIIRRLAAENGVRGLRFRRNFGKAAALAAGFEAATGDVVFQMDADLQEDPAAIPQFLEKLDTGFDIVNGARRQRRDPWHKVYPSRVFNWMVGRLTGLQLHDHNCGFKCARAEVVKGLQLYGDMHRFIPVIGHARGYRVTEIDVEHQPRRFGRSKYGMRRFARGFLDLMTVTFLTVFGQRPLHFLGGVGLAPLLLGFAGLAYLAFHWTLARFGVPGYGPIGQRPLLIYSVVGVLFGLHLISIGFLAELLLALNIHNVNSYSILESAGQPGDPGPQPRR